MQFSNDERHAETLNFLAEVRDFIASWPSHPMKKAMILRIEQHLDDPVRYLARRAVNIRSGSVYTPDGIPVLSARLQGEELTVTVPPEGSGVTQELLLQRLRGGEKLTLDLEK